MNGIDKNGNKYRSTVEWISMKVTSYNDNDNNITATGKYVKIMVSI